MPNTAARRVITLAVGSSAFSGCFSCGPTGDCARTNYVPWDGGLSDGGSVSGSGVLDFETCHDLCGGPRDSCSIADAGLVACTTYCIGGRAPPGLMSLADPGTSAGGWLARMAQLEGAAVHAFMRLARELDAHALPAFADASLRAAQHELEHARVVTGLALSKGHCPQPIVIEPRELRSLEEVAIDNAAEGCGRELFGAMLNVHQAKHAADASVRAAMASIAEEEAEHAELSFALAAALHSKLDVAQRRRVREAQAQVLESFATDDVPAHARSVLGLMDAEQSAELARNLLERRAL